MSNWCSLFLQPTMAIWDYLCCCLSLRMGALVIGVLSSLVALLLLLINSFGLSVSFKSFEIDTFFGSNQTVLGLEATDKDSDEWFFGSGVNSILSICFALIVIGCSVLLVYGALKHRKNLLLPYLVVMVLVCVLTVVTIIMHICKGTENFGTAAPFFLLILALEIYFWVCVYFLYHLQRISESQLAWQSPYNKNLRVSYSPVKKV